MLTKITTAVLTVLVLATTYASAATTTQVRTHNAKAPSNFEKTWFALPEGRDNM
jgi:hypothetical protein